MMVATGVFVDDEDKQYAALLSTRDKLVFQYQAVLPIMEQAAAVRAADPTVVALDYRLDEVTPGIDAAHTYKGSGLAQLLRDNAIAAPERDFAIVLVSNEMKLAASFTPDKTAHDLFDLVYTKGDVIKSRARIASELCALSDGYEQLRACLARFDPIKLFDAPLEEHDRLTIQEIRTAFNAAAAPHIAAKLILRNFIQPPGLLVDDAGAAALCGIDPEGFSPVAEYLLSKGTGYNGIFAVGWRRWWSNRIEGLGDAEMGKPLLSLTAAQRAAHFSRLLEQKIPAARSTWNDDTGEYVAFACASCHRPAELRHSLAAFDPKATRYANRRRICWDCIQTDRFLEAHLLVDESDQDLVTDIKRRPRKE